MNRQMNSELFSFIIRNAKKDSDITKDIQRYLKPKNTTKLNVCVSHKFMCVFLFFLAFLIRLICYL